MPNRWTIRLAAIALTAALPLVAQPPQFPPKTQPAAAAPLPERLDAQSTRQELSTLLDKHPPSVRRVLSIDPSLMENAAFLAPYPALAAYISAHPDIRRNPAYYVGQPDPPREDDIWRDLLAGVAVFSGFGMAISLIAWLVRTLLDSRRWKQAAKVHAEVNMKVLDRLTNNEDLLAYIQSPPGSRFLQAAPLVLDPAPRGPGAPFGRILWAIQGGVVLVAAGIGLQLLSGQVSDRAAQPFHAMGVLAISLGLGFVLSAIISFVISRRLGLLDTPRRLDQPGL